MEMIIPVLETQRLILRPVSLEDADDMFEYCSDEQTVRYVTFPKHESKEDTVKSIKEFFLTKTDRGQFPSHALVLKENGKMVGTCDFGSLRGLKKDTTEIGYILNREYWGQGLMTEAVRAVCKCAFTDLGLRRIEARHHPANTGSKKVMEHVGFVLEGVQRRVLIFEGPEIDIPFYSLFEEELR